MFIPPPPHYRGKPSDFSPSIHECWYGRVNLIFKMRVRTDAGRLMECQCALIETMYNFRQPSRNLGGPALLRLEPSSCTSRPLSRLCMLFHCHTSWGSCPLFQRVILAPFPVSCMDARTQATHWACATGLASRALAAPCSTSIPWP